MSSGAMMEIRSTKRGGVIDGSRSSTFTQAFLRGVVGRTLLEKEDSGGEAIKN